MEIKPDSVLHHALGNLSYFSADKLLSDPNREPQDRMIIALASAFNDLKLQLFSWDLLEEFKTTVTEGKVSSKHGQCVGMRIQIYKYVIAILHEIINLIEKRWDDIQGADIQRAISKMGSAQREHWEDLLKLSKNSGQLRSLQVRKIRNLIESVRHSASFHYCDPKELANGYRDAFINSKERKDGRAYFTLGKNMEQSRFYFADAALESLLKKKLNGFSSADDLQIRDFLRSANFAIAALVERYLKQIQAGIHTLGPSDREYDVGIAINRKSP